MHIRTCLFLIILLLTFFLGPACKTVSTPLKKEEPLKPTINFKPPDWVLGKDHPDYPRKQYLIGVGISNSHSGSAEDLARSNLAKTLKVKVRANVRDFSTKEESHIERVIETEVDTVLRGVEIKDGWLDQVKGVYYSLAVVERELAAYRIQDEIGKIESVLKRNLNEGDEAAKKGDIINALSSYLSGYQKAPTLPPLYSALHTILSLKYTETSNINTSDFESKVKHIVQDLNLATVSGDRQIVKTRKGLTEPLVAKIFIGKGEAWAPVSNVPVTFNYEKGEGELEKEKTSGSDGTVKTTVHKIASYKEANHMIAVKLDYISILSKVNGNFAEKLLLPLKTKKATFNYAVQTPKWASNKSQAWRESITDLSNQLIRNIPPEEKPLLGVMPFKDLRYERISPFSRVLNEDIKTLLTRAEGFKLKEIEFNVNAKPFRKPAEIAKVNGLDYYVRGSYRMERGGLEVRARLIKTRTRNIQSSAHVLIERKELNPEDLVLIDTMGEKFKTAQKKKSYQEQLEKLVAAKPHKTSFTVKAWTDEKEYEVNEKIVFYVKSEKNGYLTLLDVYPNGDITVIFPNKFHRDNFVRAGVTYQVPSPDYGFEFNVVGPSGLERIKAIVTLNKVALLKLDLDKGFHSEKRETTRGTRAIQALSTQVGSVGSSGWSEAYSEIFIFNEGERYNRGVRKIKKAK